MAFGELNNTQIQLFQSILNKIAPKKFHWWKKCIIHKITNLNNIFRIRMQIDVDKSWAIKNYQYLNSRPPNDSEIFLGDITTTDEYKKLLSLIRDCIIFVFGSDYMYHTVRLGESVVTFSENLNENENNKLLKLNQYVKKTGLIDSSNTLGIPVIELFKLVQPFELSKSEFQSIFFELIEKSKINTVYKGYHLSQDEYGDVNVITWSPIFIPKHERYYVLATPFYDDSDGTPIDIIYENDITGEEEEISQYEFLYMPFEFRTFSDIEKWYKNIYLPRVHKIASEKYKEFKKSDS
jgi:hypothetical protein